MYALASQTLRALPRCSKTIIPMRTSVISGPPKHRISTPEMIFCGALLGFAILATPAWVLVNLKHYNPPKEDY